MPVSINNTQIVFNDATVQTTAATAARAGITTLTLTSGSPGATLTSSDNQYVRVVLGASTPYAPSVTLPNMTTLVTGQGYFVISNETGLALAIKDSGGTTREFLPSNGKYSLNITSTATSTGVWYFNNSPILIPIGEQQSVLIPRSSYMTATGSTRTSQGGFVKLDSTNFAYVFAENVEGSNPGGSTYAKLFTVNPATGAFTAGNRVTVIGAHSVFNAYDTDNAGHALVTCHRSFPSGNLCDSFGLSVSGGTLYASAVNSFNTGGDGVNGSWVAYLGSNSAYSYGVSWADACGSGSTAARGGTVTGTTSVTYTQSANNTTYGGRTNICRTGLTTFIAGNRFLSYTPASNTFTNGTRTTQTEMELSGVAGQVSFAQSGYAYCSGKAMQGGIVFDVTNAGAAGVTAVYSASYQIKPQISTNYNTVGNNALAFKNTSSFLNSASQTLTLGFQGRLIQTDPTSSTMNISISGSQSTSFDNLFLSGSVNQTAYPPSNTAFPTFIMSGTSSVSAVIQTNIGLKDMFLQSIPVATSIV
jgi:hypothetical protein